MLLTLVAFFGILILLVFVHELGHFVTAKMSGVTVEEFGFGYPPRLFGVKWRGTTYSINALPLGGFVKMLGEEDPTAPGSLASKRIPIRMIVLVSGVVMNAILPLLLFTVSFMLPRPVDVGQVVIQEVAPGSPAAAADIQPGDVIVEINNRQIQNIGDMRYQLQLSMGQPTELGLHRGETVVIATVVPRWDPPEGQGAVGIRVSMTNVTTVSASYPIWQAVPLAGRTMGETFLLVRNEIVGWFRGASAPQVTGPVGIAELTGQVARAGLSPLMRFTAFLSINLAIINLFPIPGLDGGRLVFVAIEAIRGGRRISPRVEGMIHLIGFLALIAVILLVTYFDILRLVQGGSLIP